MSDGQKEVIKPDDGPELFPATTTPVAEPARPAKGRKHKKKNNVIGMPNNRDSEGDQNSEVCSDGEDAHNLHSRRNVDDVDPGAEQLGGGTRPHHDHHDVATTPAPLNSTSTTAPVNSLPGAFRVQGPGAVDQETDDEESGRHGHTEDGDQSTFLASARVVENDEEQLLETIRQLQAQQKNVVPATVVSSGPSGWCSGNRKRQACAVVAILLVLAIVAVVLGVVFGTKENNPVDNPATKATAPPVTGPPSDTSTAVPSTLTADPITAPPSDLSTEVPTATPTSEPTVTPTETPTTSPTSEPTVTPTSSPEPSAMPTVSLISLLGSVSTDGGQALADPSSNQYRALLWLENNNTLLDTYPDWRKIQRYALATLYYSMNGKDWYLNYDTGPWLSDLDECLWYASYRTSTCDALGGELKRVDLNEVEAGGFIPPEIGLLTALETLRLDENRMTGTLPSEVGMLGNLDFELRLDRNELTGTIPSQVGLLTNLENLWLYHNNLGGAIPSELGTMNLRSLQLFSNMLDGIIPTEVGLMTNIRDVQLGDNKLRGPIPSQIGQLSFLDYLGLESNRLTGSIPSEIGQLRLTWSLDSGVATLLLADNLLNGTIPTEIGLVGAMTFLSLENNTLSGPIPSEIGLLTNLQELNLDRNLLNSTIPTELLLLTNLDRLSVVGNNLTGSFTCPSSISICDISCDTGFEECRSL